MDVDIKNIAKLFEKFKDQEACKEYLEFKRWGNNITCPHCNHSNPYRTNRGFTCSKKECRKKFTVTSGTIMDKTKIELKKWLAAIFLFTTSKKGHSSVYVANLLGITQKTAWFMLQRIRVMLLSGESSSDLLTGIVEVDETYVGGKYKNKHYSKRKKEAQGRSTKDKIPVVGLMSRGGNVVAFVTEDTSANTLDQIIDNNVSSDAIVVTDGYKGYNHVHKKFNHIRVKQGNGYVVKDGDNEYHTQTIESFWATLKRGYVGIYHYMSRKHLNKYVNEYAYRYNNKDLTVSEIFGKSMSLYSRSRITFKEFVSIPKNRTV